MTRRATALLPTVAIALLALPLPTLFSQTRPKIEVPAEHRGQAHAIVQQLLREGKIMRPGDARRGMRGVARSVFQGTKIEEFPIVVLGVLSRVQAGGDLVLIKVLGGPVVQRSTGIIAGMSGSPVYINGRMLGAIAIGWSFPKEPIAGVTPITQMIETSLPDPVRAHVARPAPRPYTPGTGTVASAPRSAYLPREPLFIAGRRIAQLHISRDLRLAALTGGRDSATMTMRPVSTLLQLSGFSEKSLPMLRAAFARYGIEPVIGPASHKSGVKPSFIPGSAIGVQLVSGDMDQTAVGTLTFRWGKRVLAFGHPMFGQGSTSLPITTAYVEEIFPSYQRSFKLASPVDTVGALQQDTQFAIGGTVGAVADTIPMSVHLTDAAREINKTYHVHVMKDPVLTPVLLGSVATEAIQTTLGQTSDKMVRIGLRVAIDGSAPIVKHNYLYAQGEVAESALADLGQSLAITQMNEFARGSIHSVDLEVALEPTRHTARIKSLFADRNKVYSGDRVQVSVLLEPTDTPGHTITRTFTFAVPADAPSGTMNVSAGPASDYYPLRMQVGAPAPEPTDLPELIKAYANLGASNELLVSASTHNPFLIVDRQKVSNPSPAWSKLLQGSASSGVGSYNEVESRRETTDYSLSGTQSLAIPVENRRDRDNPGAATTTTTEVPKATTTNGDAPDVKNPLLVPEPGAGGTVPGDAGPRSTSSAPSGTEQWLHYSPFLRDLKRWQVARGDSQAATTTVPGREPAIRPIVRAGAAPTPTPGTPATPTPTPAPAVLPTEADKNTARAPLTWMQSTPADFLRGTFDRAQITSEGTIRLSPPTQLLATTAQAFGWSIAGDSRGNVYLGTGNPARIFKIDSTGATSVFFEAPELAVTALTTDASGNVYAGLSPGGRVMRISPTGVAGRIYTTVQPFVWAFQWAGQNLFVGTGGTRGELVSLPNAGLQRALRPHDANPFLTYIGSVGVVAHVVQKHIRAIAVRGDEVFFGTGGQAVLYRVNRTGEAPTPLYEATGTAAAGGDAAVGTEITSLVAAPEGLYFGTLNSGTIFRWNETKGVTAEYPSPQQSVYSLCRLPDGRLFAATGDKGIVYQITPAENAARVRGGRILEPSQLQALALAISPAGDLLVGTGNNAAAYRVTLAATATASPSGTFTSAVFDAKNYVQWGALRTIGDASLDTRSGNTSRPDDSWSAWIPAARNDLGELQIASPAARYLQYRGRLVATDTDATPSLSRVEVIYRAKNQPPTVAFTSPMGGEFWSKKKKLTWTGVDPNADTLNYTLSLSSDDGKTWKPVVLTDKAAATFELDTATWPDGLYRARIEASDAAKNPDDPQTDAAVSAPFTIDNTGPVISKVVVTRSADGSLSIQATAQDALSPLLGAEWQVNMPKPIISPKPTIMAGLVATGSAAATSDDWQPASAADGIFDSRRENIVATMPSAQAPKPGTSLRLRVRDAADNSTIAVIKAP